MRRTWILAVLSVVAIPAAARAAEKLEHREWTVDGVKREALLHIPGEARTRPTPVIFVFHGHGQSMRHSAVKLACHTHWPEAIVVYMEGLPQERPGWQYRAEDHEGRDLKFFDAVAARLRREFKVDRKRVYATGFSNGAGFSFLLWAERGDQLAAVATCAMKVDKTNVLPHLRPKPVMHIACKTDDHVPFEQQIHTVEAFRTLNQCGDGHPWQKECTLYPSKTGTPVVLLTTSNGGHAVPREAPALIVKFFKEYGSPKKQEKRQTPG